MSSVLIALDGNGIRRSALNVAYDYCVEMRLNVDILLVDGEEKVAPLLADFLARLNKAGLDTRLYRKTGPLNKAVLELANASNRIYVILVDSMKSWGSGIPFRTIKQPIGVLSGAAPGAHAAQGLA